MQYQGILKAYTTARNRLSAAEIKILFVICYYALFSIVVLVQGEAGQKDGTRYDNSLKDYFSCEERGFSCSCLKKLSSIKNSIHYVLLVPVLLLLTCIPIVNLVFILSWRKVGAAALSFFAASCKRVGQSVTNTLTQPIYHTVKHS